MSRDRLARIAELNKQLVVSGEVDTPKTTKVLYDKNRINRCPISGRTNVVFETMKTDECALHYLENKGSKNVTVMNFASRHSHGGGYLHGARAQEEDLCRVMPGLYASLSRVRYPYEADSILITPNVSIMRDNVNYNLLPRNRIWSVNVVSCAAQNLQREQFDEGLVRRILESMYCAVRDLLPDTDTLILGAWGCGAYRNDPYVMSQIMNEINQQFGGYFKNVVFSVPEGVNTNEFRTNIRTCSAV